MITFNTYYATNIGYKEQAVKRIWLMDKYLMEYNCIIKDLLGIRLREFHFIYIEVLSSRKHNLCFREYKIYFEDWLFTPIAYVYCDKCLYWIIFILLLYRTGSITQSVPTVKKAEDIIEIAERLYTETASVKRERSMINCNKINSMPY